MIGVFRLTELLHRGSVTFLHFEGSLWCSMYCRMLVGLLAAQTALEEERKKEKVSTAIPAKSQSNRLQALIDSAMTESPTTVDAGIRG